VSVTCAKTSGSLDSYYGIEVRESTATEMVPVRYRIEILPSGMYRIRRSVSSQSAIVLVPWTSSATIGTGLSSNVLGISQPSAATLAFTINGTTVATIADPYEIDFTASGDSSLQVRAGLASSYNLDYSAVGKETVAFAY